MREYMRHYRQKKSDFKKLVRRLTNILLKKIRIINSEKIKELVNL